ncbi:MAG: sugar phosphate isomerase/epimerase family protein [Bacillota bacterium]|jgi:sugar phosphate isomerase/epimerase|nr:sugar phosphate isomerase/epimerase family protein [Bacillota bacterium]HHT89565.1 sugar phosphate isomerase/epimerase [Bacillota bacterium]
MKYFTPFRPGQHDYEYAKRALEAGLTGFEAVYRESYETPEVHLQYVEDLQNLKKNLDAAFSVHAPIRDIHLGSLNRRVRDVAIEEIRGSLRFARMFGASLVVVHPAPGIAGIPGASSKVERPQKSEGGDLERQEELMVRAVKDLADYAPDLLIGLENLVYPHEMYRSAEELAELIKKVNRSNVGLTLDVGHAVNCGHDPADFFNLLGDSVFHVHLHDNDGVIDQHLPLGQGIIDYVAVIQSLKRMDYQGVVNLEFSLDDPDRYCDYLHEFR